MVHLDVLKRCETQENGQKEGQEMKTSDWLVCIILASLLSFAVCYISWFSIKTEVTSIEQCGEKNEDCLSHLQWCDQIYHMSTSCPLNGKVVIPADVIERQHGEFLDWCKSIGYRNVGCPDYDASDDYRH